MRQGRENGLRGTAAARAEFLENGDGAVLVRELVAASWRRSRSAGVNAEEYRTTYHADVDVDSRLVRCARPVIDRLAGEMVDVPVAIALCDTRARIVHRQDCATSVRRPLDRVDFNTGFSFAEGGVGTNGIGTVFETGSSVTVVGAEHFTEALGAFACTGAPILDPVTGRVEGVLDVSSLAEDWTPLMHTLVRRAATDIGQNLLLDRNQAVQALFEMFVRADSRRPRQAVMAVGEALMVNQRAQQLFTPAEQRVIHQRALFLMSRRQRVSESVHLGPGRTVRLRATRIMIGDQAAGMILLLGDEACPPSTGPTPSGGEITVASDRRVSEPAAAGRRSRIAGGGMSPLWMAACDRIADAVERSEALIVMGEPGTGKSTAIIDLLLRARPGGLVITVPIGDPLPPEVLEDVGRRLTRPSSGTPGPPLRPAGAEDAVLVLLRHLHRAAAEDADRLHAMLVACQRAVAGGAAVAVTVTATLDESSIGAGLPFEDLLCHFRRAVTLPALRFRPDDLMLVVDRILGEIGPGRRLRLAPEARRVIGRYGWPGNVTQLREALHHALRRRPVGEIQPDDLPAWCRTTATRTLTTIERAERDTIVGVLEQCAGNRMHAAARLGMSRSSLYRKIKAFGITEA